MGTWARDIMSSMLARSRVLAALLCISLSAAHWNTTLTVTDPARKSLRHPNGRPITAILCGPEPKSPLPLYVFGHGFDCQAADYSWLCDTADVVTALVVSSDLIPFLPDTKDLALDQAFLSSTLPTIAHNDSTSPLYGRLSGQSVLGGHSMGGGTTVLAADHSYAPAASVKALALFAPGLYTNPPAYPHKANVNAPVLIVSGAMDCGPNQLSKEALPLYQSVNSSQKALVVLNGANHCGWTSATKGVCKPGECHAITRDAQHSFGRELLGAFLPAVLGGVTWGQFEQFLANGQQKGTWSYLTMNSAPTRNVTNTCPCK